MKFRFVRQALASACAWFALSVVLSACEGADATPTLGMVEMPLAAAVVVTEKESSGLAAARTEASAGVDATGAATVNVPLWAPEGRNGIQPNLSLQYSSRGGNGIAGSGWALSGFSQIARCQKTIMQDGSRNRISFTDGQATGDRYCLNGERLVVVSGTYGTAGAVYATERESYSKIVTPQVDAEGPVTFVVYQKDGTILTFGEPSLYATLNGVRPEVDARTVRLAWHVSRVEDRSGNYMTVRYNTNGSGDNLRSPAEISYTGNSATGLAPNRSIQFHYDVRPDPMDQWVSGLRIRTTQRLATVMVYASTPSRNELLRSYRIGYRNDGPSEQSVLSTIQECDGTSVCKPVTKLDYIGGEIDFEERLTDVPATDDPYWIGDANGDGRDDLLVATRYAFGEDFSLRLGTAAGTFGPAQAAGIKFFVNPFSACAHDISKYGILADLDHDGRAEFARSKCVDERPYYLHEVYTFDPSSNRFVLTFTESAAPQDRPPSSQPLSGVSYKSLPAILIRPKGNFDFEFGYQQLKAAQVGGVSLGVIFPRAPGTLDSAFIASGNALAFAGSPGEILGRAPTTGDGYPNFADVYCYSGNPYRTNLPVGAVVRNATGVVDAFPDPLNVFDANGDGNSDVTYESAPNVVWINRGTLKFERQDWGGVQDQPGSTDKWLNFDVDGDGRVDRIRQNPLGGALFQYVKSKNGKFEERSLPRFISRPLKLMDINGDGLEDILGVASNGKLAINVRRGFKAPLLSQVTDGFGKFSKFTYSPLTASDVPPLPPQAASQPQQLPVRGIVVVSGFEELTTQSLRRIYSYRYEDGRFDLEGYGFLGFSKVVRSESATKTTVTTSYYLAPLKFYPYRGLPISETTSVVTDDYGTSQNGTDTTRSYDYLFWNTRLRIDNLATSTTVDHWTRGQFNRVLRVAVVNDRKGYDIYGNVTSQNTTAQHSPIGGGTFSKTSSTSATFVYSNDPATWHIGKLLSSTQTSVGEDGSRATRRSASTYDGQGRLASSTVEPGSVDTLATRYFRDARGLVQRIEQQDAGPKVRVTNIQYDPADFIYPSLIENVVNVQGVVTPHRTKLVYHSGLGVLTNRTDPNGVVTSWSHDGFGRPRAEVSPFGDHREIHYRRGVVGPFSVENIVAGGNRVTTEYDVMGRDVFRQRFGFDGTALIEEKSYGALGQLVAASLPRKIGEASKAVSFQSDWLGRPLRRTGPDGTVRTYEYATSNAIDSLVTETDEVGHRSISYTDPLGRTYQVGKGSFTVHHRFGAFGQPKQITRMGGAGGSVTSSATSFEYDARGRRIAIVDPDTGRRETQYNGFGEITRESTVANNTWTHLAQYDRDEFGRATWIDSPQGGTRLSWDRAGALGKLDWQRSPDGITTWYGYTPAGALAQEIWTDANAKTYSFRYTYDSSGRLANVQYPGVGANTFAVDYRYNPQGDLVGLYDSSAQTPYWRAAEENSFGQSTREYFGNGDSETRRVFDSIGRLTNIATGNLIDTNETGSAVQSIRYEYFPDGSLKLREDGNRRTTETFAYDSADRLQSWNLSSAIAGQPARRESYAYEDGVGNLTTLTTETETRQFEYASGKPHTVSRVKVGATTINYGYSERGAQTSRTTSPQATSNDRTIQYTSFDLPISITTPSGTERFQYDANRSRFRKTMPNGDESVYAGSYEKRKIAGVATHVYSLPVGGRVIGQVFWTEGAGATVSQKRVSYIHDDLINSVDTLTDGNRGIVRHAYRPFGKPLSDAGLSTDFSPRVVTHGFGGHEHDPEVGLINMSGRIYDPELAHFLTPDPIVSNPFDGQLFNRYQYARRNPLKYVDPSGFEIGIEEKYSPPGLPFPIPIPFPIPNPGGGRGAAPSAPTPIVPPTPALPNVADNGDARQSVGSASTVNSLGQFALDAGNYAIGVFEGINDFNPLGDHPGSVWPWEAISAAYERGGIRDVATLFNPLEPFRAAGEARENGDYRAAARSHFQGVVGIGTLLTAAKGMGGTAAGSKVIALDTNAVVAAIERGNSASLLQGRTPIVSMTAAKEYLARGSSDALREFLTANGGRIGAAGTENTVRALQQQARGMGRSLSTGDARVAAGAMAEGAPLITFDARFANFLRAFGYPVARR